MSRNPVEEEKIQNLINLGISRNIAVRALTLYNWDVNLATNAYLDGHIDRNPAPRETSRRESESKRTMRRIPNDKYQRYFDFEYEDELVRTPLPLPVEEEEYRTRFIEYEEEKEDRKTEFLKKTIEGYESARRMYYHALRQIYFVTEGYDVVKNEVFNGYRPNYHKANLKKTIIALRKVAESCYFLNFFEEGIRSVYDIIRVVYTTELNTRMLKLPLAVLGHIYTTQERFRDARVFIFLGLFLDPSSGILQKAKERLDKECENVKDLEYSDLEKRIVESVEKDHDAGWNRWNSVPEEEQKMWWDCVLRMCPRIHPDFCRIDMKEEQARSDELNRIDYLMVSDRGFHLEEENKTFFRELQFLHNGMKFKLLKFLL